MSLVVLGYMLLPGLMFSEHIFSHQDLCPWIIYLPGLTDVLGSHSSHGISPRIILILTRTYVLG